MLGLPIVHRTEGDRLPGTLGKNLDSLARRLLRGSLNNVFIMIVMAVMLKDVSHRLGVRVYELGSWSGLRCQEMLSRCFRKGRLLEGELGKWRWKSFNWRRGSVGSLRLWNNLCIMYRLIIEQGLLWRRICDACSFACGGEIMLL